MQQQNNGKPLVVFQVPRPHRVLAMKQFPPPEWLILCVAGSPRWNDTRRGNPQNVQVYLANRWVREYAYCLVCWLDDVSQALINQGQHTVRTADGRGAVYWIMLCIEARLRYFRGWRWDRDWCEVSVILATTRLSVMWCWLDFRGVSLSGGQRARVAFAHPCMHVQSMFYWMFHWARSYVFTLICMCWYPWPSLYFPG